MWYIRKIYCVVTSRSNDPPLVISPSDAIGSACLCLSAQRFEDGYVSTDLLVHLQTGTKCTGDTAVQVAKILTTRH
jgi:hypothetical protein